MIASAYWRMTSNQRPYRALFFQKTVASSARLWYNIKHFLRLPLISTISVHHESSFEPRDYRVVFVYNKKEVRITGWVMRTFCLL